MTAETKNVEVTINGTATYMVTLPAGVGPKTFEKWLADPRKWLDTENGRRIRATAITGYTL